jgi:hypothetical protein
MILISFAAIVVGYSLKSPYRILNVALFVLRDPARKLHFNCFKLPLCPRAARGLRHSLEHWQGVLCRQWKPYADFDGEVGNVVVN